jgi:hypothetical protein
MILVGVIHFYNRGGELLFERRYHTSDGRWLIVEQMCNRYASISYYHVLPNYYANKTPRQKEEMKSKIVRPEAKYDNRQWL